jgi:hypothetical protein
MFNILPINLTGGTPLNRGDTTKRQRQNLGFEKACANEQRF